MIKMSMKAVLLSSVLTGALMSGAVYAADDQPESPLSPNASEAVRSTATSEEAASPLDLSANVNLVSDYRFRGVSLNQERIALQGGFDASYAFNDTIGVYAGLWASTLKEATGYGSTELDVYGGFQGSIQSVGYKLGIVGYLYPDASSVDYYELNAQLDKTIGPVEASFGIFYAPSQINYGDEDGVYVYGILSTAIPGTPLVAKALLGYEDNAYFDDKVDWSLGVSYTYKQFTLGVSYIDTNRSSPYTRSGATAVRDAADATVVISLGAVF